jgi:hypothetical protein
VRKAVSASLWVVIWWWVFDPSWLHLHLRLLLLLEGGLQGEEPLQQQPRRRCQLAGAWHHHLHW